MARFRGTVQGNRGEASRLGHPNGGLRVYANSWQGGVGVNLYAVGEVDHAYIYSLGAVIYDGPVSEIDRLAKYWARRHEIDAFFALTEGDVA